MNLSPRRRLFHRRSENNVYRMFAWAILIIAGLWIFYGVERGTVTPVGQPEPTPTRRAESYASEAQAHFTAGNLDAAITAYRNASKIDPSNAAVLAELARIQTYSSALKTTVEERREVLTEALRTIDQAKALAPDDSTVAAIRAFVLDWNSSRDISGERSADLLAEADQEALRALQLDNTNTLALVFYAEILIDQLKLPQAEQYMQLALGRGEDLMDLHRVYAYLLESEGLYSRAIEEYDRAIALAPKMTFLYVYAGANYRQLAFLNPIEEQQRALYEQAIEYFAAAVQINEEIGVKQPGPYLSIAKTYSQMGEFFIAGRNVQRALEFAPSDPDVYGQLGIIFQKSRNFEGAIPALRCAIRGCTAAESCDARGGCDEGDDGTAVVGMPLSQSTLVYYYSYASILAALSRPKANNCPEARLVMDEIRAGGFGSDTIVSQILAENENICRIVDAGGPLAVRTPTAEPGSDSLTPAATESMLEPTLTPTPTP